MNKKILVQITLSLITFSIILVFFFYFYQKSDDKTNLNKKTPKIDLSSSEDQNLETNIMKDLKYLSKDINGNLYEIQAKSGQIDENNPNQI